MKQLFLLLIAGSVLLLAATKSFAEEYHGEFCWQVFSESGEAYWRYKLGIYEKEGGHLALYGSIDYGPNGISAAHGNAVHIGDSIKLTINSADYEEGTEVWAETFAAKLNKSTLNGTWNALTLEIFEEENEVSSVYQRGAINLISCQ
ncbi:MAG: hypothetical protein Q8K59_05915 [Nitrosomonas sp.]|nr:hypothetical protein [Nitrosomonas sp.]MDP1950619.1 hypothetical protein [Nitrosomonas sp.]